MFKIPFDSSFFLLLFTGQDGGGGFVRRFGRRHQIAQIAGNHFGREIGQAEQWSHACPQN